MAPVVLACVLGKERSMAEPERQDSPEEIQANYPHFKRFVYDVLKEKYAKELGELPDMDIEELARREGAMPLEALLAELERD
jgi:hypothetical protein